MRYVGGDVDLSRVSAKSISYFFAVDKKILDVVIGNFYTFKNTCFCKLVETLKTGFLFLPDK